MVVHRGHVLHLGLEVDPGEEAALHGVGLALRALSRAHREVAPAALVASVHLAEKVVEIFL